VQNKTRFRKARQFAEGLFHVFGSLEHRKYKGTTMDVFDLFGEWEVVFEMTSEQQIQYNSEGEWRMVLAYAALHLLPAVDT
jgi:hypothetical protein